MPYNKSDIQLKCGDLSPDESVWALGFSDGTIIVYSINLLLFTSQYIDSGRFNDWGGQSGKLFREGLLDLPLKELNIYSQYFRDMLQPLNGTKQVALCLYVTERELYWCQIGHYSHQTLFSMMVSPLICQNFQLCQGIEILTSFQLL